MSCALPDMIPSAARARMRGARRSRVFRNRPGIPSMLNPPAPDCSPPTQNAAETRKRKTSSNQRKWDAPFNNPYSDLHHTLIYTMLQEMIRCFRCKDTERFFRGNLVRRFVNFERPARRRLLQLNAAGSLDSLNAPPGNQLKALKGDRSGSYSIRINDQWRICFRFEDGDAYDVEIVDYH